MLYLKETEIKEEPITGNGDEDNLAKMIESSPTEGQKSQEILTGQETPSKYRNIAWTTAELEISQIESVKGIHDPFLPTDAERPIVAYTPRVFLLRWVGSDPACKVKGRHHHYRRCGSHGGSLRCGIVYPENGNEA